MRSRIPGSRLAWLAGPMEPIMELVKYEAACRALAEVKTIDEAKEIGNRAEALRAYARQAKNRGLELDAAEIRVRAERRIGELLSVFRLQGKFGAGAPKKREFSLKDFDLSANQAIRSTNLASLKAPKFEAMISDWRQTANTDIKFTMPLQSYRYPWSRKDHQRIAHLRNPNQINASDPFDKYRTPDGRLVVDWCAGELRRLGDVFVRMTRCVEMLLDKFPIANPDPLAPISTIFKKAELLSILEDVWNASPVSRARSTAGILDDATKHAQRALLTCEECGNEFKARRAGGKGRRGESNENRFCSRKCSGKATMAIRLLRKQ